MKKTPNVWNDNEIKLLTALWEKGLSASIIANEINRTRNAVIGKVHRLGLGSHVRKPPVAVDRQKVAKPRKPKVEKMTKIWVRPRPPDPWKKRSTEIVMPDKSKRVSILQVKDNQCRAIVEYVDGKLDQAICCGEPVTVNRFTGQPISWCAYHHSIYFEPPKESRDARGGSRRVVSNWSPRRTAPVQSNPQAAKKSA